MWSVPAAVSQGEYAGEAVVVSVPDTSERLSEGGSATVFTLRLPDDASCPGDSANDQYRVQSFIVPVADDLGALTYETIKPEGDGRWALYDTDTRPVVHALTEPNNGGGQPGRIGGIPPFSFAVFPPGELPDGTYHIGIACSLFKETVRHWATQLVLTAAPADEPGRLRWRLAADSGTTEDDGWGPVLILVPTAAVLAVVAIVVRGRRSPRSDAVKENA